MNADLTYQAIMGCAILTGYVLSRRTQRTLRLAWWERLGILAGAFCGAMITAKLPFVFSDWRAFVSGAAWLASGKTIVCGLAGGYLGVEVAKWSLDIKTRTGDSFAVPVAVSVGIGRFGCFHAECCYGTRTQWPWGVVFPSVDGHPRHPTQMYEAAFHLTAAVCLATLARRGMFRGNLIKLYIIAYAVYRFGTEWIRPELRYLYGMTGYQWSCLLLIGLFSILWYRERSPYPLDAG
jgi:phosphatidylglycerol:prolipoprotein diacylglycerol transferase